MKHYDYTPMIKMVNRYLLQLSVCYRNNTPFRNHRFIGIGQAMTISQQTQIQTTVLAVGLLSCHPLIYNNMIKSSTISFHNITDECKLQQDRSISISLLNNWNNLIK